MGIVNRTPDSFFDQGATFGLDRAVEAALAAAEAGAGWIDIGGVPFSPDTAEVSEAEEIDRVVPVVAGRRPRQRHRHLGRHVPPGSGRPEHRGGRRR